MQKAHKYSVENQKFETKSTFLLFVEYFWLSYGQANR